MDLPSVNDTTTPLPPAASMAHLGSALKRLIAALARAPLQDGDVLFAKLDIKDKFWRMSVSAQDAFNFAYVLPQPKGQATKLIIPTALQMGWCESPPFFCAATETARDVARDRAAETHLPLPPHPLETYLLPPHKWKEQQLSNTCNKFLHVIEVYVDNFIALAQ